MVRVLASHQCSPGSNPGFEAICGLSLGTFFGRKSKFTHPKTDLAFFWATPKTDHESIKSTFRVDSSDQIQIRIFLDSQSERFSGKRFEKSTFDKRVSEKNGT